MLGLKSKKFVVYTVMVGGYDDILQPLVVDDRFDYVLFTDEKRIDRKGVWEVRSFDYRNMDKTRESRYPKMHPEELLPEYEASLYTDANLQITDRQVYEIFLGLIEEEIDWAGISLPFPAHPDCIYDHAFWVLANALDYEKVILELCHFLRKEEYPRHNGLFENNIIFRRNNNKTLQVDLMWWELYSRYSRRDQLTLGYVLWKNSDVNVGLFLPKGKRGYDSSCFFSVRHRPTFSNNREVKLNLLELLRDKIRAGLPEQLGAMRNFHYDLYALPVPFARICLFFWGIFEGVFYGPKLIITYVKRRRIRQQMHSSYY